MTWGRSLRNASLLAVLLGCLLAWPLHSPPIGHHGEAREGLVVQSIVHNQQWVLPYRNGELPSKPPLFHWIAAALAHPLGLSDTVLRFPSAVGAWLMAAGTLATGTAMGGELMGWLSIACLLGMEPFWETATEARVDMIFAAFLSLALFGFYFWCVGRQAWSRGLCYIATACAVLAKGPVAVVLVGLIIVSFSLAGGEVQLLGEFWSWPLLAVAAAIDIGWYVAAFEVGGRPFLDKQLLDENVYRFLGLGKFTGSSNSRLSLSMLITFATQVLPWSLLAFWDLYRLLRRRVLSRERRFLHCWWIGVVGFFTLSAGRRNIYLLPAYPAVALLAAGRLREWFLRDSLALAPRPVTLLMHGVRRFSPSLRPLSLLAFGLLVFDLALLLGFQTVRLYNARRKSLAPFAYEVQCAVPEDAPLYAHPDMSDTDILVLAYRLGRTIIRREFLASDGAYYLVRKSSLQALPDQQFSVICSSNRRSGNVVLVAVGRRMPAVLGPDLPPVVVGMRSCHSIASGNMPCWVGDLIDRGQTRFAW